MMPRAGWALASLLWAMVAGGCAAESLLGYLETTYATTGWKHQLDGDVFARPVVSADGAVVYSCFNGPEVNAEGVTHHTGHLVAMDATTGAELWRFLNPDLEPFVRRTVCPVVMGDTLLVVSDHSDPRRARVLFVRAADGKLAKPSPSGGTVGSPVNVTGYHARTRVPCMYLDPDDRERFDDTCNYTMPVRFSPVVATKPFPVMFVVASDKHMYAVNVSNSALLPIHYHCPGLSFVHRYQPDGSFAKDGDPLRNAIQADCRDTTKSQPVEACPGLPSCTTFGSPPVLSADHTMLYVAASDGLVFGLETGNRTVRWEYDLGAVMVQEPVLTRHGLVVVHGGGRVFALHPPNGTLAWSAPFVVPPVTVDVGAGTLSEYRFNTTEVYVSDWAADDYIYVKDDGATIYALDHGTGAEVFRFHMGRAVYTLPTIGHGDSAAWSYVGSRDGRLFGLRCGADSQFVVDRLPYRCEDLSLVVPSQRDLCEELERRCPDPR